MATEHHWQTQTRGTVAHRMTTGGYTACGRRLWTSFDAAPATRRCATCQKGA